MRRQTGAPFFCFYKERFGTGSPPHPTQCAHWGTYGLWWLRLDLTEQSPGLFDPQGEGFGGFLSQKCFPAYFPSKMRPKSVLAYRRQQPFDRTKANQPQTQRVGTSGHKNRGSRGLAPGPLSPHFSGEMGTPAGQAGPRGAAPRGTVRAPPTRRVPSGTASPQRPPCYRGPSSRQGAGRANPWSMGPAPCPRSSMAPRAPER